MELERKAKDVVEQMEGYNHLEEFNAEMKSKLNEIYRDEFKLELLTQISVEITRKLEKHHSDGSCKKQYPDGECPIDKKYENAFRYVEQEIDRIVDNINVYGNLNRLNAHIFGETFTSEEKKEINEKLDCLMSGQLSLLEGQLELHEQLKEEFPEMKEMLNVLNKGKWLKLFQGEVLSAGLAIGVNKENLIAIIENVEKTLGVN